MKRKLFKKIISGVFLGGSTLAPVAISTSCANVSSEKVIFKLIQDGELTKDRTSVKLGK